MEYMSAKQGETRAANTPGSQCDGWRPPQRSQHLGHRLLGSGQHAAASDEHAVDVKDKRLQQGRTAAGTWVQNPCVHWNQTRRLSFRTGGPVRSPRWLDAEETPDARVALAELQTSDQRPEIEACMPTGLPAAAAAEAGTLLPSTSAWAAARNTHGSMGGVLWWQHSPSAGSDFLQVLTLESG